MYNIDHITFFAKGVAGFNPLQVFYWPQLFLLCDYVLMQCKIESAGLQNFKIGDINWKWRWLILLNFHIYCKFIAGVSIWHWLKHNNFILKFIWILHSSLFPVKNNCIFDFGIKSINLCIRIICHVQIINFELWQYHEGCWGQWC